MQKPRKNPGKTKFYYGGQLRGFLSPLSQSHKKTGGGSADQESKFYLGLLQLCKWDYITIIQKYNGVLATESEYKILNTITLNIWRGSASWEFVFYPSLHNNFTHKIWQMSLSFQHWTSKLYLRGPWYGQPRNKFYLNHVNNLAGGRTRVLFVSTPKIYNGG